MTLRQNRADIFWFSLFHEIGHILNKDENNYLVDFEFAKGDEELEADNFANKELINQNDYKKFVENDVFTLSAIKRFAKRLRRMGIDDKLIKMGAKTGDSVRILDFYFDFTE